MCGELEDEGSQEEEFYARFSGHAYAFLASLRAGDASKGGDAVHSYLDSLFRQLLASSADESKAPEEISGYERLSMEPLVFARLAGFMAAHLPLQEDPLHRVLEALMIGYSEGEIALPQHDHDHGHAHGHDHPH